MSLLLKIFFSNALFKHFHKMLKKLLGKHLAENREADLRQTITIYDMKVNVRKITKMSHLVTKQTK